MRDDVDTKHGVFDFVDRQADTINGDRALAGNVAGQLRRHFDLNALRARIAADRSDGGNSIDVTRHQVPAQRVTGFQRWLEVHRSAGS